jgi:hypothetical protein
LFRRAFGSTDGLMTTRRTFIPRDVADPPLTDKEVRSGISTVADYAAHELRRAEKLEQREPFDALDAARKSVEAERARADAVRLLKPPHNLIGDASTEIVPAPESGVQVPAARKYFVDTLEHPSTISVDASEQRASLATRANVLSPALDAAVSARARNSIEKMLCHQLATVHMAGMELIVRVEQSFSELPPVERARLTNAAARMFEVFQNGCLTLLKLRTRGKQRVLVQHQQINVAPGGNSGRRSHCRGLAEGSKELRMNPLRRRGAISTRKSEAYLDTSVRLLSSVLGFAQFCLLTVVPRGHPRRHKEVAHDSPTRSRSSAYGPSGTRFVPGMHSTWWLQLDVYDTHDDADPSPNPTGPTGCPQWRRKPFSQQGVLRQFLPARDGRHRRVCRLHVRRLASFRLDHQGDLHTGGRPCEPVCESVHRHFLRWH